MSEKLTPVQEFEIARQTLINLPIGIHGEDGEPKTIHTVFMNAIRLGHRVTNLPLYERFSFAVSFTTKFMDELQEEQRKFLEIAPPEQADTLRRQVKPRERQDNVVCELRAALMAAGFSDAALQLSVIAEAGGKTIASALSAQRKPIDNSENSHTQPPCNAEKLETLADVLHELSNALEPGEKEVLDDLGIQSINRYAVSLY